MRSVTITPAGLKLSKTGIFNHKSSCSSGSVFTLCEAPVTQSSSVQFAFGKSSILLAITQWLHKLWLDSCMQVRIYCTLCPPPPPRVRHPLVVMEHVPLHSKSLCDRIVHVLFGVHIICTTKLGRHKRRKSVSSC